MRRVGVKYVDRGLEVAGGGGKVGFGRADLAMLENEGAFAQSVAERADQDDSFVECGVRLPVFTAAGIGTREALQRLGLEVVALAALGGIEALQEGLDSVVESTDE